MIFSHGIVFSVVLVSVLSLMLMTLVGRWLSRCLPWRLRATGQFYLSPVLGLSVLTLLASWIGRFFPFGQAQWLTLAVLAALAWLLWREPKRLLALRHAFGVGLFGLVCGAGILTPLWLGGGYDSHNDTFTNLAHAMWLQDHAFSDVIDPATVKPYATQILLYQQAGFRMGGSYLLALLQAMFHARWSYEIFPALLIVGISCCCLAIGMVLARPLRALPRWTRLAMLALPAFSIGGISYGAYYGFMAQTVGLALGAAAMFLSGHLLVVLGRNQPGGWQVVRATWPLTLLLSAALVAYSELAPFWGLTLLLSAAVLAWRTRGFATLSWASLCVLVLTCVLLNTELLRAYRALRVQVGAVVGSPVDWPLFGFIAHGLGVHGGAWGGLQWVTGGGFFIGCALLFAVLWILAQNASMLWRHTRSGVLLPSVIVTLIFFAALLYFRYKVASPFPTGTGQSWSQAKLMDWVFPFSAALILAGMANWRVSAGKWMVPAISGLFALGLLAVVAYGAVRLHGFQYQVPDVPNLQRFYLQIRQSVQSTCPPDAPVYLGGGPDHMKFRQTLSLYLYDRDLHADWHDDVYMVLIPAARQNPPAPAGSCFIELRNNPDAAAQAGVVALGHWQVRRSTPAAP